MRDITLDSSERRLVVLATSPEFAANADGFYDTVTGQRGTPDVALQVYLHDGPLPGVAVQRNKALRAALAEQWPGHAFRVRNGWGNQARVEWTDGPTATQVADFAWSLESLTPAQAHFVQATRLHSLRGCGVSWLRTGSVTWPHTVDLTDITEREAAIVAGVARLAGFDLAAVDSSAPVKERWRTALADLSGAYAATLDCA